MHSLVATKQSLPGPGARVLRVDGGICKLEQPRHFEASDEHATGRTADQVFLADLSTHTAVISLRRDGTFFAELQTQSTSDGTAKKMDDTFAAQQGGHYGRCTLRGVTGEMLADVLTGQLPAHFCRLAARRTQAGGWDCAQILATRDAGLDAPVLLRLRWPSASLDTAPRLSAEHLNVDCSSRINGGSMSSLQTFLLHAEVLVGTEGLVDGPLVAVVELSLPSSKGAPSDAHSNGAMRLVLGHLISPQRGARGSLVFEAGPVEAVLSPVWGPIVAVCTCCRPEMLAARRPPSQLAMLPPVFVCTARGVHCVLSHQVLSADLCGLMAMVPVIPEADTCSEQNWNGTSVLLLADSGELYTALLQTTRSTRSQAAAMPSEERVMYELRVAQISGGPVPYAMPDGLPLACTPCMLHIWQTEDEGNIAQRRAAEFACWFCRWLPGGGVEVLNLQLCRSASGKSRSMELKGTTTLHVEDGMSVAASWSECSATRRIVACCCLKATKGAFDRLCVAFEEPRVDRESTSLELWHPGSPCTSDSSGKVRPEQAATSSGVAGDLRTNAVQVKHSWPLDAELIDVGDDPSGRGWIVAVTSFSSGSTLVFRVANGKEEGRIEELIGWGQQSSQPTLHMRFLPRARRGSNPSSAVLQLMSREIIVFCGASSKKLCTRGLATLCCHAASLEVPSASWRGDAAAACWVYIATASVLMRYDISVSSHAASAEVCDGPCCTYLHQIAALCALPSEDCGSAPRIAATFWLSKAFTIIDGASLAEISRFECICGPSADASLWGHTCSLVALPGRDIFMASADGSLVHLQFNQDALHGKDRAAQDGITLAGVWRLHDGPLQLVPHVQASGSFFGQTSAPCVLALGRGGVSYIGFASGKILPCQSTGIVSAVAASSRVSSTMIIALCTGEEDTGLASATLEAKEGPVITAKCDLIGHVLDMVHSQRLNSLLVMAQAKTTHGVGSRCPPALVLLDESLSVLSVFSLTGNSDPKLQSLGCASGISVSLYELWDGVLLAASAQGGGSPRSLVRARITKLQDEGSWLDASPRKPEEKMYVLKVLSSRELDAAALIATHSASSAPVLLSSGGAADGALRVLDKSTLVEQYSTTLAGLHLEGRGVIVGLAMTHGFPANWAPVAVAAAGSSFYACVALAAGAPAVLQLHVAASEMVVLRQVVQADPPLPPLMRLTRVESDDSDMSCGFMGLDGGGRCFMWRLMFDAGPLDRPSVELRAVPYAERQLSRHWAVGCFAALHPRTAAQGNMCLCVLASDTQKGRHPRLIDLATER